MQWWQIVGTALLPWIFERIWTIKGLKKVPEKLRPTIEQTAQLAVEEALRRGLGHEPNTPPPTPVPRPGRK